MCYEYDYIIYVYNISLFIVERLVLDYISTRSTKLLATSSQPTLTPWIMFPRRENM
jgi:hypothetical protein